MHDIDNHGPDSTGPAAGPRLYFMKSTQTNQTTETEPQAPQVDTNMTHDINLYMFMK